MPRLHFILPLLLALPACKGRTESKPAKASKKPSSVAPSSKKGTVATGEPEPRTESELRKAHKGQVARALEELANLKERILDEFDSFRTIMVRVELRDGDDTEWLWVRVMQWKDTMLRGTLVTDPSTLTKLSLGQELIVQESDIVDFYLVDKDFVQVGAFTGAPFLANTASDAPFRRPSWLEERPSCPSAYLPKTFDVVGFEKGACEGEELHSCLDACGKGNTLLCYTLAVTLDFAKDTEMPSHEVVDLFARACQAGHPSGCTNWAAYDDAEREFGPCTLQTFEAACRRGKDPWACTMYAGGLLETSEELPPLSLMQELAEGACQEGTGNPACPPAQELLSTVTSALKETEPKP